MPPVIVFALGVLGVAAVARWYAKEVRRVAAEFEALRAKAANAAAEPVNRDALPKLKPDPVTGEYRPG